MEDVSPAFVQATIEKSLSTVFGEIGGNLELEVLNFSGSQFTIKTSADDVKKLNAALTLIAEFQGVPCYFRVNNVSSVPPLIA